MYNIHYFELCISTSCAHSCSPNLDQFICSLGSILTTSLSTKSMSQMSGHINLPKPTAFLVMVFKTCQIRNHIFSDQNTWQPTTRLKFKLVDKATCSSSWSTGPFHVLQICVLFTIIINSISAVASSLKYCLVCNMILLVLHINHECCNRRDSGHLLCVGNGTCISSMTDLISIIIQLKWDLT